MASRLSLQTEFEKMLGSRNVYYQPPESLQMKYPAIRYSPSKIDVSYADDRIYKKENAYSICLIDEDPESEFIEKILAIPHCRFNKHYASDNLNHFTFTLYY